MLGEDAPKKTASLAAPTTPQGATKDMSDKQREDLQRTIEERKKEIAARKELLQRLKNQLAETYTQAVGEPSKDVSDYLKEAMALAEKAKQQVQQRMPELTPPSEEEGKIETAVARPTEEIPPSAIEVPKIEPQSIVYEKASQTDFPLAAAPPTAAAQPAGSPSLVAGPAGIPKLEAAVAPSVVSEVGSAIAQASVTAAAVSELPDTLPEEPGAAAAAAAVAAEALHAARIPDLTADERGQIMRSDIFRRFVEKSTFTVEKALNQDKIVDIFETYSGVRHEIAEEREVETLGEVTYYEEPRLSSKRPVFCVKPSPKFPSLFLASYGRPRDSGAFEAGGSCLVWSLESTQRPVNAFISSSPVTAACFNQYNPNLVFGGTSVGSILLWDMRVSQRYVQKTRTTQDSHQNQIQHIALFGSAHNQVLLTVDEANKVCLWSVAMSMTLANCVELGAKKAVPEAGWDASAAKFMTLAADAKNNRIMGGCADGSAYLASISNTDCEIIEMFQTPNKDQYPTHRWHGGPITGISMKPDVADFRLDLDLALTSSLDWTVRLWDLEKKCPIRTFEVSDDYVFDCKWSPSHPTVFATADGSGSLSIWNLHRSWHRPALRQEVFPKTAMTSVDFIMEGKAVVMASSRGQLATAPIGAQLHALRLPSSAYFDNNFEAARAQAEESVAAASLY